MKYIAIIILSFFCASSMSAQKLAAKTKFLLANVSIVGDTVNIGHFKVDAALTLALALAKKHELISLHTRDSIVDMISRSGRKPTAIDVANDVQADFMLFANVRRLKNMLRVELVSAKTDNPNDKQSGIGYSLIHYWQLKDGKPLVDPTLLEACQRAFLNVQKDSTLYNSLPDKFNVLPTQTMVIGGIEFKDDATLPQWDIFNNQVVNAFFIAESIFEIARDSKHHTVYDLDTRDAIYAMANLYGVENYSAPTQLELETLRRLDVDLYLSGRIARTTNGAAFTLFISEFQADGSMKIIKKAHSEIEEDSINDLQKEIYKLCGNMLEVDIKKAIQKNK